MWSWFKRPKLQPNTTRSCEMTQVDNFLKTIDKLFEETMQDKLEVPDETWIKLQQIAKQKEMELNDIELRTNTGKVLVNLDDENAWDKVAEYLEIDDVKDAPTRTLAPVSVAKAVVEPQANMQKITIIGKMGAELPGEDELKQILSANLKPLGVDVDAVTVKKNAENVEVELTTTAKESVKDDDIKKAIMTNTDKIMQISNIVI